MEKSRMSAGSATRSNKRFGLGINLLTSTTRHRDELPDQRCSGQLRQAPGRVVKHNRAPEEIAAKAQRGALAPSPGLQRMDRWLFFAPCDWTQPALRRQHQR